jgi:hypothetical protein
LLRHGLEILNDVLHPQRQYNTHIRYNEGMGKPRFRPSSLFTNPRDFGRNTHPTWSKTCDLNETDRAWAWYQHRVALEVQHVLAHRGLKIRDLAKQLDKDEVWLQRKLFGHVPADLGEILSLAVACGVEVLPLIDSVGDIVPRSTGVMK